MKVTKLFTDLQTIEEFLKYYETAGRLELKSRLKTLGKNHLTKTRDNERKAIITWLK